MTEKEFKRKLKEMAHLEDREIDRALAYAKQVGIDLHDFAESLIRIRRGTNGN
jgi:SOS response regulatory protein OraA/RecX